MSVNTPLLNLELQKYLPEKQLLGHFVSNSHLLEDSPRPPSYSFMAFSYSLLASSALRSHSSSFSLDIPFQVSPAFLERSVTLIPGWSDLIFSRLAFSHSM